MSQSVGEWLHTINLLSIGRFFGFSKKEKPVGGEGEHELRMIGVASLFITPAIMLCWQFRRGVSWLLLGPVTLCGVLFWTKLFDLMYAVPPNYTQLQQCDAEDGVCQELPREQTISRRPNHSSLEESSTHADCNDPLSTYCKACEMSFRLWDHHCGIIGTCVHEQNRSSFIQTLIPAVIGLTSLCCCILFCPENASIYAADSISFWPPDILRRLQHHATGDQLTVGMVFALTVRTAVIYCLVIALALGYFLCQQVEFLAFIHSVWWFPSGSSECAQNYGYLFWSCMEDGMFQPQTLVWKEVKHLAGVCQGQRGRLWSLGLLVGFVAVWSQLLWTCLIGSWYLGAVVAGLIADLVGCGRHLLWYILAGG